MDIHLSIEANDLIACIFGSKVTDDSGQLWRYLHWSLDSTSEIVNAAIVLKKCHGPDEEGLVIKIADAKAFSRDVSVIGEKLWPRRKRSITAYCFRHQAAADMKFDQKLSSTDISAALGHLVDVTKSRYGSASMGKAGGVAPSKVQAHRPVKVKELSLAAKKKNVPARRQKNVSSREETANKKLSSSNLDFTP